MTAQRKPIMMKKPLNMAIRPMPPYGEFAPVWGTSCRPIPKTIAHPMNRKANRNLAFGLVTLRTQLDPPSAVMAERRMIPIIVMTMIAEIPKGIGC